MGWPEACVTMVEWIVGGIVALGLMLLFLKMT